MLHALIHVDLPGKLSGTLSQNLVKIIFQVVSDRVTRNSSLARFQEDSAIISQHGYMKL